MAAESEDNQSAIEIFHNTLDELYKHFEEAVAREEVRWDTVERNLSYGIEIDEDGQRESTGEIPLYLEGEEEILGIFVKSINRDNKYNKRRRDVSEQMSRAYKFFKDSEDKDFRTSAILYEDITGHNFETLNLEEDLMYQP